MLRASARLGELRAFGRGGCDRRGRRPPVALAHLAHEVPDPRHGLFDLLEAGRVAAADEAFAARAKRAAGNAGDFLFLQQAERKIAAAEAGARDAREAVE